MASVFATIPQINAILEGYYSSKGKPYDNLFQSYYDENNMEQEENTFLQEEFQYDTDNPNLDELAMIHTFDDNNSIDEFLDTDFHNLYQEQTNLNIDQRRYKLLKYIYKNNKLPITTHQAAPKLNLKSKLKIKIDIEEQKRNEILDKYYHKQLSSSQLKNAQDMEYFLAIGYDNNYNYILYLDISLDSKYIINIYLVMQMIGHS